jgi:predicted amino acid racemase
MVLKRPDVITVYSVEKAREISKAAAAHNMTQKIMVRVIDEGDTIFPGQYGGFYLDELCEKVGEILILPAVELYGVTSFPCFSADKVTNTIKETHNLRTVLKARELIEDKFGIELKEINTPSATCAANMKRIAELGGTHGEPGHGLSGTTPLHAQSIQPEIPAIAYVSEVSHNLGKSCYCCPYF